jgi:hypothetical protein
MLTAVLLVLVAQMETPPPAPQEPKPPTSAKVTIETPASGVSLVDRASKKPACSAPCGQLVRTDETLEYVLTAPGAVESDPFSLRGATTDVTLNWRPGSGAARGVGTALIIIGGLAVMTAIGMGIAAIVAAVNCGTNAGPCNKLDWAWATLPLSVGGYVVLGIGMTLSFRFGFEKFELEIAPPAAPQG